MWSRIVASGITDTSSSAKSIPASSTAISSTSFCLDRLQAPRQRALQLLRRNLRLIQRLRIDQVAHRLGLREIDAPVQKRPHGELARLGQARSGGHAEFHNVPQHHRRSVRRNLDDVVGRVGMRLGEVSDDDFVDALAHVPNVGGCPILSARSVIDSVRVWMSLWQTFGSSRRVRSTSSPNTARPGSSSCFSRSIGSGNLTRLRARQSHHADSAAPRRRGDRDDRVIEIHSRFTRRL